MDNFVLTSAIWRSWITLLEIRIQDFLPCSSGQKLTVFCAPLSTVQQPWKEHGIPFIRRSGSSKMNVRFGWTMSKAHSNNSPPSCGLNKVSGLSASSLCLATLVSKKNIIWVTYCWPESESTQVASDRFEPSVIAFLNSRANRIRLGVRLESKYILHLCGLRSVLLLNWVCLVMSFVVAFLTIMKMTNILRSWELLPRPHRDISSFSLSGHWSAGMSSDMIVVTQSDIVGRCKGSMENMLFNRSTIRSRYWSW